MSAEERPTRSGRVWTLRLLTSAGELVCSYFPTDDERLPDRSYQVHALVRDVGVFNNAAQFRLREIRLVDSAAQALGLVSERVGFPLDGDTVKVRA